MKQGLGLFLLITGLSVHAMAAEGANDKNFKIEDARIFAPLKGTNATAGYGKITNSTKKDFVLSVGSAKDFKATELHESYEENGRMHMRKIESLTVPAGGSIELKPGGHHIMLFDAKSSVKEGGKADVELKIDGAAKPVTFKIVPRVKAEPEHHHH